MGLIQLVVLLGVLGFVVYLVTTKIPMNETFKMVIYVIVALVLIVFLMRVLGISDIPVPQLR